MKYKFRGKKLSGGWVGGYVFQERDKSYIIYRIINGIPDMVEVDHESVGMFIGVVDKNGIELCEMDVIKYKWDSIATPTKWKVEIPRTYLSMMNCDANCIEIIGNTIDNPELMETK